MIMKKLTDLEYLRLNTFQRLWYNIVLFVLGIPGWLASLVKAVGNGIAGAFRGIRNELTDCATTFTKGSWKTKVSYLVMGFGNIARGQVLRGLLFLVFESVFIVYMVTTGSYWLGKFRTLGDVPPGEVYNEVLDTYVRVNGDDSFKILLYGLLTILFIIAFVYTWRLNVKQNRISEEILATGKKLKSGKDDLRSVLDDQFHKTLLALPITGILVFTIIPILFMILVAFTNYDGAHDGYSNLFTWVGLSNFNELISSSSADANLSYTFGEILSWTLMWAFFATFTNYFLGMLVAILINKKGIHFKKLWRGILVLTIAVPQFISLLYVSKLFDTNGVVNAMLLKLGFIDQAIRFWENTTSARILVIVINIWVGIPYLMLVSTGILMNIPQDLYESSKIDGASVWQQYMKITLPYMLFVTGPYLLTQFIGNINNFNVIYLLTQDVFVTQNQALANSHAKEVDLLVTWLFRLTNEYYDYKMASVIGIIVFIICAAFTLISFSRMISGDKEEEYQ